MAKNNDKELYCRDGHGVIVLNRSFINSPVFLSLNTRQQALIRLLQEQWKMNEPIAYGVREAARLLHCRTQTASHDFDVLQNRGFIVCINQSLFNSRTGSRSREWRLTWMPYDGKIPTNEWRNWKKDNVRYDLLKNKSTVTIGSTQSNLA